MRSPGVDVVNDALLSAFREHPTLAAIVLVDEDGRYIGTCTLRTLERAAGTAGVTSEPGAADHASQPAASTAYRAVRFACGTCGTTAVRSFYDDRDLPVCAPTVEHGPMALVR
ncbi:hypothetical protein AB0M43_36805 [Longispora sp. NPDC051575]|uniref:hypothetical protein n=1 Tax=Longispora sp. NPDC051575 TaxID=3154943 RepID=UPI00343CA046